MPQYRLPRSPGSRKSCFWRFPDMTRTKTIFLGLVACVLLAGPGRSAAADPVQLLPDDTQGVVVVNIQQILDAPLVKKGFGGGMAKAVQTLGTIQPLLALVGLEIPCKEVTRMVLSLPAKGSIHGLLVVQGSF